MYVTWPTRKSKQLQWAAPKIFNNNLQPERDNGVGEVSWIVESTS